MTTQVNIHEAKTHLSRLLEAVERGEEVVIARAGKPIATLSAYKAPRRKILPPESLLGTDWVIPGDFDEPMELRQDKESLSMAEVATPYHGGPPITRVDNGTVTDLIRRAAAGEEILLSADGMQSVRLVAVRRAPDAETKRRILEEFQAATATKITPGPSAARSQDFLYDENGLPA